MSWWRIPIRQKDPDEDEIFEIDWEDYLSGSTISSVIWTVPSGIISYYKSNTNIKTFIGLKGGIIGIIYRVSCRITTSDTPPRQPERSIDIKVENM